MNTRERLARSLAKHDWSVETPVFEQFWRDCPQEVYYDHVDAILDELMEPGEGPLEAGEYGIDSDCKMECDPSRVWQAVITAIREGK